MSTIVRPNRREMILTSGILLTGISQVSSLPGQEAETQKELNFLTTEPRNGEPELNQLIQSWITPNKHFYVRSHAPNPKIDAGRFRLRVEGQVHKTLSLTLDDLGRFPQHTITATLTCAGNRRIEFNQEAKVGGVQWGSGAIGNARWTGVALADVLEQAGLKDTARHVWFEGLDQIAKGDKTIPFGASIPIEKALSDTAAMGALLVTKMNGETLPIDHGYPLRTVVPGYIGARSVKWLGKIVVSDRKSPNHYVATAYKIIKKADSLDWAEAGPIYRYPINAAIASQAKGATLKAGPLKLAGYVLPTGIMGSRIERVQVSVDAGKSWKTATLTGQQADYCWRLWEAEVQIGANTKELIVRASDSSGGFMPARVPWNAKGYLQNSWYRLPVEVR